ncbi:MAG: sterol desaturase family protein [Proteobacteria bacterium]|nr:sterol desaturase family protein [Pseudomonadota bacterium]
MHPNIQSVVVGFLILLALFRLLERLRPRAQRLRILRRGFATDLGYWFFTPVAARAATTITTFLVLVPVAWMIYGKVDREVVLHGYGPASRLPMGVQGIAIVAIVELIGYWMHRAFHRVPWLWRFHAVHHSSVDLDWLSATRVHPGNDVVMKLATTVPILVLGFAPAAVAGIMPLLTLLAVGVHAHVDWDWGPLRSVIVSPRFHRWHHSDEAAARNRNFAGLLPVLDILFGTYHMPRNAKPAAFGAGTPIPEGMLRQLAFPFRRTR